AIERRGHPNDRSVPARLSPSAGELQLPRPAVLSRTLSILKRRHFETFSIFFSDVSRKPRCPDGPSLEISATDDDEEQKEARGEPSVVGGRPLLAPARLLGSMVSEKFSRNRSQVKLPRAALTADPAIAKARRKVSAACPLAATRD